MLLYHTSDREIPRPDVHYGRKNADFGQGFYLMITPGGMVNVDRRNGEYIPLKW